MTNDELIAIIQELVGAKPFQPFYVKVSGHTFCIEVAWLWQDLVDDGKIDPKQIVEIALLNKLDQYYDYREYERAEHERERAAFFDPKEYKKLLQTPEWKEKSKEIIAERGGACEECGDTKYLQAHHRRYDLGRDPWDYSVKEFKVLCRECHSEHHI